MKLIPYDKIASLLPNFSPLVEVPIQYNTSYSQNYFIIPISEDATFTCYVNFNSEVLPNMVYYDYFGSGEFYVNSSSDFIIHSVKDSFVSLYRQMFIEDDYFKNIPDNLFSKETVEIATSVSTPTDLKNDPIYIYPILDTKMSPNPFWAIHVSKVFNVAQPISFEQATSIFTEFDNESQIDSSSNQSQIDYFESLLFQINSQKNSQLTSKHLKKAFTLLSDSADSMQNTDSDDSSPSLCSDYTYVDSVTGVNIVSKNYKYANVIEGAHVCSSPHLSKDSLVFCSRNNNHSSCPYFVAKEEIILSKDVIHYNTDRITTFTLSRQDNKDSTCFLVIRNATENTVLYAMIVDEPSKLESLTDKAIAILDETVSSYQIDTVSDSTKETISQEAPKESYILSLAKG